MLLGDLILASNGADAGVMRTDAGGSDVSGVEDRMTIGVVTPGLLGSTKLPTKVAPAASTMTSPFWAALIAACRSPPAGTLMVAASTLADDPTKHATANAHTRLLTQRGRHNRMTNSRCL